jgi:threonine/homoserine/homoserine lactone efflux protein
VLLFALVAATSPLALASVLVVLTSGRGRLNGSAFAIGFVAGQAAFCALAVAIGSLSFPQRDQHPTLQGGLEIAVGASLLVAAVYLRRRLRSPHPLRPPNARAEAFRHRLSTLRPATALGTGTVLGVGGPKRLGITLVVVATITSAGLSRAREVALATTYVIVGTALVWVPVLLYVLFGRRASEWLTNAQHWISAHKDPLTFYPSVVLGLVLVGDGIVQIVS